jgi:hypothetical protein
VIGFFSSLLCCCGRAGFEAEAVISGFQDMATMCQAVEQSSCHLGIAEDGGPFAEAEVGGDDDAGALIKLAQQVEQQRSA